MEETIKSFIIKHFQAKKDLQNNESLFENDIIDSFGMLELTAFIEKKFSIRINPSEISIENFDSINKIVKLVNNKKDKNSK